MSIEKIKSFYDDFTTRLKKEEMVKLEIRS